MSDVPLDIDAPCMPDVGEEVAEADAHRSALSEQVRDVLGRTNGSDPIVQVSVSLPPEVDPLGWLRAQPSTESVYWSGRRAGAVVAGTGAADCVEVHEQPVSYAALEETLTDRLARAEAPLRYYGGLRFDARQPLPDGHPDDRWKPFGTARFVLPRLRLVHDGASARLTCTLVLPRDGQRADAIVETIQSTPLPVPVRASALPSPVRRTDAPTQKEWTRMVAWALRAFDQKRLDKVVLARRVALTFGEELDPLGVLQHLEPATPGCFHFAVQPNASSAFIGASPERLFRLEGRTLESEAVAGTRSRGDSDEADAALRHELLESDKDRREHAFVEDAIRDQLDALCETVAAVGETTDLELARGRHLHSRLQGQIRPGVTPLQVLAALHPTPAVGGVPQTDALTAIRNQEPFDRGWYAGPVGWVGPDRAEFAVAIRSGLVRSRSMDLFSGAGIVDGSVPSREWNEIEQKIGDFAAVLGIRD